MNEVASPGSEVVGVEQRSNRHAPPDLEQALETVYRLLSSRNEGDLPRLRDWLAVAETWRIDRALKDHRQNRTSAARELGIGRRTLYTKMERFGLDRAGTGTGSA